MCKLGERKVPRVFSDFTLLQVPICLAPFVETFSVFGVVPPPLVSANLLGSSDAQKNVCPGYIYPLDDGGSDGYLRCVCIYLGCICNYYMYYMTPDTYSGGPHCVYIHLYVYNLCYSFCETLDHQTPFCVLSYYLCVCICTYPPTYIL